MIPEALLKLHSNSNGVFFSEMVLTYCKKKKLKFIYSEKATKFCKIFTLLLSYVVPVKSKVKISQNFVAFSEYTNFKLKKQDLIGFQAFLLEHKRTIRSQRFMNIKLVIAFHYIYPQIFVVYFLTSNIYSLIYPHPI